MTGRRFAGRRAARPARPRSALRRVLDVALAVAILGALMVVAARLGGVDQQSLEGQARVADGDSIELGGERIRLRGIDAPEFDQTCQSSGADYPCGRKAREALVGLIGGAQVTCEGWERDRYGRLLASCSARGVDLNRQLVQSGWAVAYGDFEDEEAAAKAGRHWPVGRIFRPAARLARHTWRHGGRRTR